MAIHCSILAWKIPWTEELGGLQSVGSQRAGHDLGTKHAQSRQKFLFLIWYLSLAVADLPLGRAEGWRAGPGHSHHAYLGSSWEKGHFIPSLEPDLAGGCPTQVPSLPSSPKSVSRFQPLPVPTTHPGSPGSHQRLSISLKLKPISQPANVL